MIILSSVLITALLIIDGYLYGKVYTKFISCLSEISCIALGVLSILAIFQVFTFIGIGLDLTYHIYLLGFILAIILPFILVVIFRVNIIPNRKDFISIGFGIVFCILLGIMSSKLNTNNAFYDSTFYMSKVVESSSQLTMAHISNYTGAKLARLDLYYDYQGYYYLWGMILKLYRNIFNYTNSLAPLYLWGASFLYYFCLGVLVSNSVQAIGKVKKWFWVIFPILLLPYVTNYFNTTLGFFGNSFRTVGTGYFCLIMYLLIYKEDVRLFFMLFMINLGTLCLSSSSLFINVLLSVGLFIYYNLKQEKNYKVYFYLILSALPLLYYLIIVFNSWEISQPIVGYALAGLYFVLLILFYVFSKNVKLSSTIVKILPFIFPVILVLLIVGSFVLRNIQPYSYYFNLSSKNDMLLNYTNWIDGRELLRNILLWLALLLCYINFKFKSKYKLLLLVITLLFLNPLTMPMIYIVFTKDVYHRIFEMIVNPFNLAIIFYSLINLFKYKIVSVSLSTLFSIVSFYLFFNITYSNQLIPYQDDYNYQLKVSESLYDMYGYIENNVEKDYDKRPLFISQDINLKAYIPNILVSYSTIDYRAALEKDYDENDKMQEQINYFYPNRVYEYDSPFDVVPNYANTCEVIISSQADYVLLKSDIATVDENNNYMYTWWNARACSDVEYENDHWVLLKVRSYN
ncbi:MAG: hypothetical protein MR210_04875 [Erysipelotrichaceae bacterium]|nr:hypothetical protein [Erysipelotrichaceae bacterium]